MSWVTLATVPSSDWKKMPRGRRPEKLGKRRKAGLLRRAPKVEVTRIWVIPACDK